MAKRDTESQGPLTAADVQRLIDASLLRHDVAHGHLHADDLPAALDALRGDVVALDSSRDDR